MVANEGTSPELLTIGNILYLANGVYWAPNKLRYPLADPKPFASCNIPFIFNNWYDMSTTSSYFYTRALDWYIGSTDGWVWYVPTSVYIPDIDYTDVLDEYSITVNGEPYANDFELWEYDGRIGCRLTKVLEDDYKWYRNSKGDVQVTIRYQTLGEFKFYIKNISQDYYDKLDDILHELLIQ